MVWKPEVVMIPVTDGDRAKAFQRGLPPRRGRAGAGAGPATADFGSFVAFADPDGNGWLVQQVRGGGRVVP
jgi:hypothetical protein